MIFVIDKSAAEFKNNLSYKNITPFFSKIFYQVKIHQFVYPIMFCINHSCAKALGGIHLQQSFPCQILVFYPYWGFLRKGTKIHQSFCMPLTNWFTEASVFLEITTLPLSRPYTNRLFCFEYFRKWNSPHLKTL